MIKKPTNWNEVREITERKVLPVSAYVCRIKKAVVQDSGYGDQLCVLFDISEGDFLGYYANEYKENQNKEKKWKGVLRVWIPKDDGTEKDEWTKRRFKGFVSSVERSNNGYVWDWNEASLSGKEVGVLFRSEEWEYSGKTGWYTRPFIALSVDSVNNGEFTIPDPKPLKKSTLGAFKPVPDATNGFAEINDDDAELPF